VPKVVISPCGRSSIVAAGGHSYPSTVAVGGRSHWLILVVGPVDVSGRSSPSVGRGAGTRGHSSMVGVGFHGRSWVLVNRGGGPPWLIVRGPGGPPSPSTSGGAGSTWTLVGARLRWSVAVPGASGRSWALVAVSRS
jgi:hypothetical protein